MTRRARFSVPVLSGLALCAACTTSPASEEVLEIAGDQIQRFQADERLYDVREILPDEGGTWILSGSDPYLYRFDLNGRIENTFFREGDGPGEARNPWSLARHDVAGTEIALWDVARRVMHRIDRGGTFQGSFPMNVRSATVRGDIRTVSHADPHKLRGDPEGYVLQLPTGSVTHTSDLFFGALVRVDRAGAIRDTLLAFRSLLPDGQAPVSQSLADVPLWDICPGGTVVVYDPTASAVLSIAGGREQGRTAIDLAARDLTDADIRPYLRSVVAAELSGQAKSPAEIDEIVDQVLPRARAQFPAQAPKAVDLLCDAEGRLWVNEFSTADHPLGFGRTWKVFREGRLIRRVRFPAGFRPLATDQLMMYGVVTDGDDVQAPAKLPLPRI